MELCVDKCLRQNKIWYLVHLTLRCCCVHSLSWKWQDLVYLYYWNFRYFQDGGQSRALKFKLRTIHVRHLPKIYIYLAFYWGFKIPFNWRHSFRDNDWKLLIHLSFQQFMMENWHNNPKTCYSAIVINYPLWKIHQNSLAPGKLGEKMFT